MDFTREVVERFRAAAANLWRNLRLPGALWYLAVAAFFTSGAGILAANKFVLPALDVLAVLPVIVWARLNRGIQGTAWAVLFWAFCKAAAVAFFTVLLPARAAAAVAYGADYADGMWVWLGSGADLAGVGAWGTWRLKEALLLAGLSLATAGAAGFAYAATLLNCQAYYLGTLLRQAAEPWRIVVFGWPVWEVFRAFGLVNIMLAAAEPGLSRVLGQPLRAREMRDAALVGLLMLAAAYVGQTFLAPWWRDALAPALLFDAPPL
ncbi:MAG TPA: hypothetical protein VMW93_06465 [bacterium]|nr:hypothetical protein [bacterium]